MMNNVSSTSPSFNAGLNYKLYKRIKSIDVPTVEKEFEQMGVDAEFNGSKTFAATTSFVSEIMEEASKRYNLPFEYKPSSIYVYKNSELVNPYKSSVVAFVNEDSNNVIKNRQVYPANSMFINKQMIDSPVLLDLTTTEQHYFEHAWSTPHFLHSPIHEWFHNIHNNIVFKQLGFNGECPIFRKKYPMQRPMGLSMLNTLDEFKMSPDETSFCLENFGKYSCMTGSLLEFFSEAMTKFMVKSLDKDLNVVKNPLDNIPKEMPKRLKKFLEVTLERDLT